MLIDTFSKRIFNLSYQFSGSSQEAEDMTQEIFMKIHQSLRKYDPRRNFEAWMLTLARNQLIDRYRKTKWEKKLREDLHETGLKAAERSNPEAKLMNREAKRIIWKGFNQLSSDIRIPLILREIQGKNYDEIAEIMKLPLGTVKSRISRGRIILAKILKTDKEKDHDMQSD